MVSHDNYCFSEEFDSAEEAIKFVLADGAGPDTVIAECQMQDFDLGVDGSSVLEMLQGQNEELIGEGEFIDATREQELELGKMVTAAIEAWAVKHRISLTAWTFAGVRNKTPVKGAAAL